MFYLRCIEQMLKNPKTVTRGILTAMTLYFRQFQQDRQQQPRISLRDLFGGRNQHNLAAGGGVPAPAPVPNTAPDTASGPAPGPSQ